MAKLKIDVHDLHKYYGENEVLKGISTKFYEGDVVCIIGPSGSGKSTFLRSLNLLEEVTKGQITVNGYDLTDPKTNVDLVRENIGMVFRMQWLHWRQLVVLFEILMLFVVGFLPQELNLLANSLVSFSCAMQVQSFRKVNGYAFASTMCIGNLRSGMDSLCAWLVGGSTKAFGKALHYFAIIFLFALGAGLGSLALAPMGSRAIWLSCLLLFISFCLMFLKEDIEELEEFEHLEHEEALKK